MLLTIWNFTRDPIPGYVPSKPAVSDRFSIQSLKKQNSPTVEPPRFLVQPYVDFSTTLPKGCCREITLLPHGNPANNQAELASGAVQGQNDQQVDPPGLQIRLSVRNWKIVPVAEGSPWRLFLVNVSRTHRKLMVFQNRNTASFLSSMPDRLPLSSLLLPATHETMAFYGWPISQCQTKALSTQLQDGIRVLDIRLAVIPTPIGGVVLPGIRQNLIAYHGVQSEKTPFQSILTDVHNFLTSDAGRNETIVMSIKQEDFQRTPPPLFSQKVREFIINGPGGWDDKVASTTGVNRGMWFLENRLPTLGEVRGKVVLFSRFGENGAAWPQGLEGLGIHPTNWPDSSRAVFDWELKGTRVRTHDWYGIPSLGAIPEKVQTAAANLIPPRDSAQPILPISFFSGSKFPLALPPAVARGIVGVEGANSLFGKWLIGQIGGIVPSNTSTATPAVEAKPTTNETSPQAGVGSSSQTVGPQADNGQGTRQEPRIRGWAFLDFYSEPSGIDIVPLLIECNFLGRTPGEEGW